MGQEIRGIVDPCLRCLEQISKLALLEVVELIFEFSWIEQEDLCL